MSAYVTYIMTQLYPEFVAFCRLFYKMLHHLHNDFLNGLQLVTLQKTIQKSEYMSKSGFSLE